jgi:predicted DNA-binding transcriptional regulator AlpA
MSDANSSFIAAGDGLDSIRSLSLDELAGLLGMTRWTIQRHIERGEGPRIFHIGSRTRITCEDAADWIERLKNPTGEMAERIAERAARRREASKIANAAPLRATGERRPIGRVRRNGHG